MAINIKSTLAAARTKLEKDLKDAGVNPADETEITSGINVAFS